MRGFVNSCSALTAVGALLCFLPLMSNKKSNDEHNKLSISLESGFKTSITSSISLIMPMLLLIFLNFFSVRNSIRLYLCSWNIISCVIPLFVLLCDLYPSQSFGAIPPIYSARTILIISCGLTSFGVHNSSNINKIGSMSMIVVFALHAILDCFEAFENPYHLDYKPARPFLLLIFILIFGVLVIKWAQRVVSIVAEGIEPIELEDLVYSFDVLSLVYLVAGLASLEILYGGYGISWLSRGSKYISYQNYIVSSYCVIFQIAQDRFKSMEVLSAQAKREAENKRMIVGYFSHEIRTPLNTVLMGLQLLQRDVSKQLQSQVKDKLLETITELHESCDVAIDILNDLLTYEQLESGEIQLMRTNIPVVKFFQGLGDIFKIRGQEKDIDFRLNFQDIIHKIEEDVFAEQEEEGPGEGEGAQGRTEDDSKREERIGIHITTSGNSHSRSNSPSNRHQSDVTEAGSGPEPRLRHQASSSPQFSLKHAYVIGDEEKLSHVVRTVVTFCLNASAAQGSQGSVEMEVRLKDIEPTLEMRHMSDTDQMVPVHKSVLVITVVDKKQAMSKERRLSLFKEDIHFKAGVLRDGGGSSLGFWISNRIMLLHGGTISVTADDAGNGPVVAQTGVGGTTFTIEVPVFFGNSPSEDAAVPKQHSLGGLARGLSFRNLISTGFGNREGYYKNNSSFLSESSLEQAGEAVHPEEGPHVSTGPGQAQMHFQNPQFRNPLGFAPIHHTFQITNTANSIPFFKYPASAIYPSIMESEPPANAPAAYHVKTFTTPGTPIQHERKKLYSTTIHRAPSTEQRVNYGAAPSMQASLAYDSLAPNLHSLNSNTTYPPSQPHSQPQNFTPSSKPPSREQKPTRTNQSRVLVVDDAPLNRKMLVRLLEGHCGSTVAAEDGAVAVKLTKASIDEGQPFDLILMDYQMPVMDGPSAAKAIREMGFEGPIIGVTGNALPADIHTYMRSGANRVLLKPLDYNVLKRNLAELGWINVLATPVPSMLGNTGNDSSLGSRSRMSLMLDSMSSFLAPHASMSPRRSLTKASLAEDALACLRETGEEVSQKRF